MITVAAIHIAPVKSLGLAHPQTVQVGSRGIVEDRRFYLVNRQGRLVTQREMGPLVQVTAEYTEASQRLRIRFPKGDAIEGPVKLGKAIGTPIWGRRVWGHLVEGDWNAALAEFCGESIFLVASDEPGQCYDEYPPLSCPRNRWSGWDSRPVLSPVEGPKAAPPSTACGSGPIFY